jgi:transposase
VRSALAARLCIRIAEPVWAYRGTPRIDRDFRLLKGYPSGIRPLYVQRDDYTQGMVRFLSLARRLLTLVEYVVMSNHAQNGKERAELPGLTFSLPERDLAR